MKPPTKRSVVALCLSACLAFFVVGMSGSQGVRVQEPFETRAQPLLAKYCAKCHGEKTPQGGFRLSQLLSSPKGRAERDHWSGALAQIKKAAMPPAGQPRPSGKETQALIAWIEQQLQTSTQA